MEKKRLPKELRDKIKAFKNEIIEAKVMYWAENDKFYRLLVKQNKIGGWYEGRWFNKERVELDKKNGIVKGKRDYLSYIMRDSFLKEEFDKTWVTQYEEHLRKLKESNNE